MWYRLAAARCLPIKLTIPKNASPDNITAPKIAKLICMEFVCGLGLASAGVGVGDGVGVGVGVGVGDGVGVVSGVHAAAIFISL